MRAVGPVIGPRDFERNAALNSRKCPETGFSRPEPASSRRPGRSAARPPSWLALTSSVPAFLPPVATLGDHRSTRPLLRAEPSLSDGPSVAKVAFHFSLSLEDEEKSKRAGLTPGPHVVSGDVRKNDHESSGCALTYPGGIVCFTGVGVSEAGALGLLHELNPDGQRP